MPARIVERIGSNRRLRAVADRVIRRLDPLLRPGPVKTAASGAWMGHRLHPMLTDAVIGTWTSAVILDWWGGDRAGRAADRLVAAGLVASLPTTVTGLSDWTDVDGRARATALVHAVSNGVAGALFALSLRDRYRGRRRRARVSALAGASALGAGGYLGGHLSYVNGVGVDHTAFRSGPAEWTRVLHEDELPHGALRAVAAGERDVLLARRHDGLRAFDARCTHAGAPLVDGQVEPDGEEPAGCLTCPRHRSVFSLSDGSVRRGPAATPQERLAVRVADGWIEVRAL